MQKSCLATTKRDADHSFTLLLCRRDGTEWHGWRQHSFLLSGEFRQQTQNKLGGGGMGGGKVDAVGEAEGAV